VNCFAVCCALPAGSAIEYGRKFKLYIFSLVFLKTTFLVVGSYSTPPPPGARGKTEKLYCLTVVLVMLICVCCASSTEARTSCEVMHVRMFLPEGCRLCSASQVVICIT